MTVKTEVLPNKEQVLVEIARTNFDEEGTVTCLARLANSLSKGGKRGRVE